MKKGFTLIELLAVIVLLAILAVIAVPIVLNIIDDAKESSNKRSIDLYSKAVENAIARYQLNEGDIPNNYEELKDYIDYSGTEVICEDFRIYSNGTNYLGRCSVGENYVESYSKGDIIGEGTLAHNILSQYGDANNIGEVTNFSNINTIEKGLFSAEDDFGVSYYFRGNVENNYVKFGSYLSGATIRYTKYAIIDGWHEYTSAKTLTFTKETPMYWRIIRINGDGTIRLMYSGTEKVPNGTPHVAIVSDSVFSNNHDKAKYVGYTYDDGTGKQINSSIKTALDTWYETNLKTNYGKYIADGIFCNDKRIVEEDGEYRVYQSYYDIIDANENKPDLKCYQKNDRYTLSSDIGNGYMSNPVGLFTASEVIMAGEVYDSSTEYNSNKNSYLYSGDSFVTMTPNFSEIFEDNSHNTNFIFSYDGGSGLFEGIGSGVRPIINLKADVKFTGDGSFSNPYIIVTE